MALLTYDTRRHSPQFLRTTNLTHARNPLTPSVTRCDALGLQLHLACAFFLHDTSYFFPPHCAMPVPTPMNLAAHIQDFTTEAVHLCPLHLGSTFPGPLRRTRRHSGKMASSEDRLYRLPCRKCVRYCLSSPSLTLLRQFLNNFRHSSYARHASLTAVLATAFARAHVRISGYARLSSSVTRNVPKPVIFTTDSPPAPAIFGAPRRLLSCDPCLHISNLLIVPIPTHQIPRPFPDPP